jgi:hypothetical protein
VNASGSPGVDRRFRCGNDLECAGPAGAAGQRSRQQQRKIAGPGSRRHIDEQLPRVESHSRPDAKSVDRVFVVADKEERRSPGTALAFDFDPHGNPGVLPDDAQGGDRHRRPFPVSLAPERFPFLDDVGVDTNRGVVDEDAIVHRTDIDRPDLRGSYHADGLGQAERQAEIFREVIERAERENPERRGRIDDPRGNTADRPIAAAGDDDG